MKFSRSGILLIVTLLGTYQLSAQCGTAYMSSEDTILCVPQIIKFTVHKAPAGTTFEWDLGSGYVNSDSTYTKLYSTAGNYNVRVRLRYLDNSTCVMDYPSFIQAKPVPVPAFTVSKPVICNYKDSLVLTDITPKTVKRDWLVDNTLYSNGPKQLTAIFKAPTGYKNFTMFMVDSFGCKGRRTFDSAVFLPDSISTNFEVNKVNGCTPAFVSFNNLTDTLGYKISSWNWEFPGGLPLSSTQYSPKNIRYNTEDTFDIKLNVTTARGCTYSKTRSSYLMFADSTTLDVSFSKTNLCGNEVLEVKLNNSRSIKPNIDVSPETYTRTITDPQTHQFKFTNFGQYSFYVTDIVNGCISEKNFNNHVNIQGPIAGFEIPNAYSCLRPDTFSIFDTSKISMGMPKNLQWDLYRSTDLSTSLQTSTQNPARLACDSLGLYSVRLIVSSTNGCRDTLLKKNALEIKKIEPEFSWKPRPACPVEEMEFINETQRGTSKAPNRYRWTFYDNKMNVLKYDTVRNPKLSYGDTGHYTVKLVAFNNLGCKDSLTRVREVLVERPIPTFRVSDSNVCYKNKVGFKVLYNDSNYYKTYIHQWHFQHTDSAKTKYTFNGDSITVALLPGTYRISYTRFSARKTCYDTLVLPYRLKVSGVFFEPKIDPVKVCNPFLGTLIAKQSYSYNYLNGSTAAPTYNWSHQYDTNKVAIWSPSSNPSPVYIKKSGYFYFKFKYTHSSGCNDSANTSTLTSGVVADFIPNANSYYACVGKPLNLINRSDKDAIKFKWFLKDSGSGAYFLPSDTVKNPKIVFNAAGKFKMGLIAYGNGNCSDTIIATINSNDVKAQFTSEDTLNYCAPIIARITATKHPVIYEYKWYLGTGDSITNNLSSFAYLYKSNTGPQGSDVKLMIKAYGCNDTMDRKGFIKVIGPIPKFKLTNNIGCEKLRVNFINESKYYKKFFLEYGDGSVLDSVNFDHHIYKINDRSLSNQKFKPTLSVIDSFGCIVQYEKDTVFVLRSPEAQFSVNNDTGCANMSVQFLNLTVGGVSFKWDYNGDGVIDNTGFGPKFTYPPGDFNPVLIAKASNNCEDTARNMVFIKSYARPEVTFTSSVDTVCYNVPVDFEANNLPSNGDIAKWSWDFGDPTTFTDTAYTRKTSFKFKKLFLSQVVLLVTDIHSCTDTFTRFIYTNDTIGPQSKPLNFITINSNQFIDINWGKSGFKKFTGYRLFNDNAPNFTLTYATQDIYDTTYRVASGVDINTTRYCYTIKTKDMCQNLGAYAPPHCTILLQIRDTAENDLILDWLPYVGWGVGNIKRYRIYKSENGGVFKLYDSVSNNITSYRDKKLCPGNYCYYIEAIEKGGRWKSKSNTACRSPLYIQPSIPVTSIRTTVLPGNKTYTQWRPYKFVKNIDHYLITRYDPQSGRIGNYAMSDSTGFIDIQPQINTSKMNYSYFIRAVDHCGEQSPEGPINTTILLGGKSDGYKAKLHWTDYEKWFSGVKHYDILIREDNTFKVVATVDDKPEEFEFDFPETAIDDSVCFKVRAVKDSTDLVESFSNVICLISDAQVHVPTAFSPNGDGHNDTFRPTAIMVFNKTGNPILDYELEIYNRWGERVFETDDVNIGWDGTFMGQECPQGTYVYRIKALALDGLSNFHLQGTFVLLR